MGLCDSAGLQLGGEATRVNNEVIGGMAEALLQDDSSFNGDKDGIANG